MTKVEAIHILENLKPTNTSSSFDAYDIGKALIMAISALSENKEKVKNMRYKIMVKIWDTMHEDYYWEEYSGCIFESRDAAAAEAEKASRYFEDVYIQEV